MFGVARRVLANFRRHQLTENGLADALKDELRLHGEIFQPVAPTDATAIASESALAALDESDRELLTLTAWERLTPAEIGVMTGRSAGRRPPAPGARPAQTTATRRAR